MVKISIVLYQRKENKIPPKEAGKGPYLKKPSNKILSLWVSFANLQNSFKLFFFYLGQIFKPRCWSEWLLGVFVGDDDNDKDDDNNDDNDNDDDNNYNDNGVELAVTHLGG